MSDISNEDTNEYLKSLPQIEPQQTFCFDCNPEVPCFNRCCAELNLPLTPYDILRLCRNLSITSLDFINTYTTMRTDNETGLPSFTLRMQAEPGEPCPFVTAAGCMVYEDRPSACRAYPLGRGTKMGNDEIIERFFVVREEHCHGFDTGTTRTPAEWFASQHLLPYNESNDRYMRLMSLIKACGKPLDQRLQGMSRLCLYHLDQFREMIKKMKLFTHVQVEADRQTLIMEDSLTGDTACLEFALDWMELVIFGQAKNLVRI